MRAETSPELSMSYGRRRIYTDETEITAKRMVTEVNSAFLVHTDNRNEIRKLYRYYRSDTAIENKTKEVRENINFKIGEARCLEVTNFYKGYIFRKSIQYVRRENTQTGTADGIIASDINDLHGYMADVNKANCDSTLSKWMLVAGTTYKMGLPNKTREKDGDEPPFNVYAPDPRRTFVVYSSDGDKRPVMNVSFAYNRKMASYLTYESVSAKEKEIVSVSNNSDNAAEFVCGYVLFYKCSMWQTVDSVWSIAARPF